MLAGFLKRFSIATLLFLFFSTPLFAYNFLYIHPTSGEPIAWEAGTTIEYWLDPGDLGQLTNEQAHTLLQEAMKIWEEASPYADVPTFEFAGYLPEDVTGENYEDYVSLFQCYTDDIDSCVSQAQKDLQTVVIFDEDRSILNNELCKITSCVANAGAKVFSGSSNNPQNIVQGIAVFGPFLPNALVATAVHELGHLMGLAHSVVNQEEMTQGSGPGTRRYLVPSLGNIPVDDTQATLNPDDIAGISVLYPSQEMEANTATIQGEILKSDLTPMMHVNVIARNVDDPLCEAYSFLSGRFCRHSVAVPSNCINEEGISTDDGSLSLSGLPPGSYTLEVEEIADDNLAFTLAPGLVDPFIYGDAEFWNQGDAVNESNALSSVITLSAGEVREGVDIILNRSEVTDDRVKFISLDTFEEGPSTLCPEDLPKDYEALVGWEGSENEEGEGSGDASSGGCSLLPH